MLRVRNQKTIRRLADRSFSANRTRNRMAVIAIILTTLLFSALFTTAISVKYSTEQATMRQVGGYAHGGFKDLTEEQKDVLKTHPLIEKYGTNKVLTALEEGVFEKGRVEVRYIDENGADMFFCTPTTGSLPKTERELATDTWVLDQLGVPHKIGEPITVPFVFHGETIEESFTLSGFWERDSAAMVSQMWLSEKFVDEMLSRYTPDNLMESMGAGKWNLDICFADSKNIQENLRTIAADYLVAHKDLFKNTFGSKNQELKEEAIASINSLDGIEESGVIYWDTGITNITLTKEQYLRTLAAMQLSYLSDEIRALGDEDSMEAAIEIYGLDEMPFQYLKFAEGDVDYEEFKKGNVIIQLVHEDDYGNPYLDKAPYSVGDEVTFTYADEYEYMGDDIDAELLIHKSHTKTYTIGATAVLPGPLTVRRYGSIHFAMASEALRADAGEKAARMSCLVNMEDGTEDQMEEFLNKYVKNVDPDLDFASKKGYSEQFQSFRQMFLLIGTAASLVVALVGILNYINAIVTGIRARRREMAVLQSIGMTGRQLIEMLILEGCAYGILAIMLSLALSILMQSLILRQLEHLLWFFTAKWIWTPIFGMLLVFMALGAFIPVLAYHMLRRQSVVERLREAE